MRFVGRNLAIVIMAACAYAVVGPSATALGDVVYWGEYTSGFGAVYKLDVSTGTVSTFITGTGYGPGGNHIDDPQALTVDKAGNVYVGNGNNGDIVKVTPQGVASDYFAVPDPVHYSHTYGLTFDPSASLYVARAAQGVVARLPPGGGSDPIFASGLDRPQGGATDPVGNVYVETSVTATAANVTRIAPDGTVTPFATSVVGILWDATGNRYTGEAGAITLTTSDGETSTLASGFVHPFPVGLGASGDAYVFDYADDHQFFSISATGVVRPIATLPFLTAITVAAPEPSPLLAAAACLLLSSARRQPRRQRARRAVHARRLSLLQAR